jgi:hypothetical protein
MESSSAESFSVPFKDWGISENTDRFIALRALAFHGEEVELPRLHLRDLDLSSIPVGVKRPSLHFTLWWFNIVCCFFIGVGGIYLTEGLSNESL